MISLLLCGELQGFRHGGQPLTGLPTTTFTWDIAAGLPVVLDGGNQYVYGAGLESMLTGSGTTTVEGGSMLAAITGSNPAAIDIDWITREPLLTVWHSR